MSSRAAIYVLSILVGTDHTDACAPFGFGFAESALRSRPSSAHGRSALYGNTTSTLKNLIPALFSSVTGCHSPDPSNVAVAAPSGIYKRKYHQL